MCTLFDPLEKYIEKMKDWKDPYPDPVIEEYDGVYVLRDDLLEYGSKIRFLDYLVSSTPHKEIVYGGCPATGYAQISLSYLAGKYNKKAVLFMAKRSMDNLHPYQKRAIELGVDFHWVKMGMLNVTTAHAKRYALEDPENRILLPMGLKHESATVAIMKIAQKIKVKPTEIWSVAGSGTLTLGLQRAFPDVPVNVVQVGHKLKPNESGRAKVYVSPYKFDKPVKESDMPPFPSAPTYDAKAWSFVREYAKPGALFWNVGA